MGPFTEGSLSSPDAFENLSGPKDLLIKPNTGEVTPFDPTKPVPENVVRKYITVQAQDNDIPNDLPRTSTDLIPRDTPITAFLPSDPSQEVIRRVEYVRESYFTASVKEEVRVIPQEGQQPPVCPPCECKEVKEEECKVPPPPAKEHEKPPVEDCKDVKEEECKLPPPPAQEHEEPPKDICKNEPKLPPAGSQECLPNNDHKEPEAEKPTPPAAQEHKDEVVGECLLPQEPEVCLPPKAQDDHAKAAHDCSVKIDVLANDQGLGPLCITSAHATHGKAEIVDGQVKYTPKAGFTGEDTLHYTVSDKNCLTDEGMVSVTVDKGQVTTPTLVEPTPPQLGDAIFLPPNEAVCPVTPKTDMACEDSPKEWSDYKQAVLGAESKEAYKADVLGAESKSEYKADLFKSLTSSKDELFARDDSVHSTGKSAGAGCSDCHIDFWSKTDMHAAVAEEPHVAVC